MRKSSLMLALTLTGCGGTTPEVYQLLVDAFTLPDSCYTSMMQPSTVVTTAPPTPLSVQVWDGPDNTAFLQVESAAITVDMGAAPNVTVGGIFTGKKVEKGWTFSSDGVTKQTLPGMNVITTTTHAEITFERAVTFKGTGVLSSSSSCAGSSCPGTNPSCSVSGLVLTGTKVAVNYERAP
jgi:hypothetical protein